MNSNNLTDSFIRLRTKLKKVAFSILQNDEDAEDALQDAFCRLWSSRASDDSEATLRSRSDGAAVVTVKRVCIDYLRSRKQRASDPLSGDEAEREQDDGGLWREERLAELQEELLEKLPPVQRKVFEMVSRGIEYDIVALRLDMSEASVRQAISRARKTLRNEYGKII